MVLGAGETTTLAYDRCLCNAVNGGKRLRRPLSTGSRIATARQFFTPIGGRARVATRRMEHQPEPVIPDTREQVADPGSAFQIVTMLEAWSSAAPVAIKVIGKPIAGKTGPATTGTMPGLSGSRPTLRRVCISLRRPGQLGDDETGGMSQPRSFDFMIAALKDAPATPSARRPGCGSIGSALDRCAGRRRRERHL